MAENEQSNPQEAEAHAPVIEKVDAAIDKPWEKPENSEYQKIRKQLQDRLAWHGGGVGKHFIDQMTGVTDYAFRDHKTLRLAMKGVNWTAGLIVGSTTGAVDIAYNVLSWPLRRFLPIPKDIAKRTAISATYGLAGAGYALTGAENIWEAQMNASKKLVFLPYEAGKATGKVMRSEPYQKGLKKIKAAGEAIFTAPEVAGIVLKKKVDSLIEKIKKPVVPK